MSCSRLAVLAFPGRSPRLRLALERLRRWASQNKSIRLCCNAEALPLVRDWLKPSSLTALRRCHAVLALGGDGTVLTAARMFLGRSVPLLGVNTGKIGFLTEHSVENLEQTLDRLVTGDYTLRTRSMLDCKAWTREKCLWQDTVLNELHVKPGRTNAMIQLQVQLNGKFLTEYWADSLLISTPTGSTGYNLSAGGPILHPTTQALVLNPVNPISLSVRPLVIPASCVLTLRETAASRNKLVLDGRVVHSLQRTHRLEVKISPHTTSFVRTDNPGFMAALREKLGWTGKPNLPGKE